MPAPSPSWNLIRVHGLWHTQGGALLAGQYKVTIPARITNSLDDAIIPAGVFDQGELQTGVPNAPSLDIMVPATDDPDNEQAGWKVIIEVTFVGGAMGEKYVIDVPLATGAGGINLRTIALSAQIPAQNALYRVGVAGGLAKLNSNGDVIDADGTVVGGLDPVVLSGLNADIAGKASNAALASLTTSVSGKASTASVTALYNTVAAIPAADTAIGTAIGDPVSSTRVALGNQFGPVMVSSGAGDQTTALNSFLAAATPLGVKRLIGSFNVSDTVAVGAGVYLDASKATITQTGSSKTTITLAAGASLVGGTVVGKGTDYVAGAGGTPLAVGCKLTAADTSVSQTVFMNHAGAGVMATAAPRLRISNVRVVGIGSPTIPAMDSSSFGIYLLSGCNDATLSQVDISKTSIGIIGSYDTDRLTIDGARVGDIAGQHGIYLQNAKGLRLTGISVWNCNLNGIKIQLNFSVVTDMTGVSISGIVADGCGDCGLIINNTDPLLVGKVRAVTLSNVSVSNCARGLYLGSLRGAQISNVAVYNATLEGVTFIDAQDVSVSGMAIDTTGRTGIRFTGVTNGSNARISMSEVRIKDPGGSNVAVNVSGIFVNQASDLAITGIKTASSNGFTDYSIWFASTVAGEQSTFTLRDADLTGGISSEIRLATGPLAVREFSNVRLAANAIMNYPSALVTRSGSVGFSTVYSSNAIPSGMGVRGDICWNSTPSASGVPGWVCTAASTWKTMPAISA